MGLWDREAECNPGAFGAPDLQKDVLKSELNFVEGNALSTGNAFFDPTKTDHESPGAAFQLGVPARRQSISKRCFDVVIATCFVVLLAPLFLFLAVIIKAETRGPALFKQRRLGRNQKEYRIFKFRTMSVMEDGSQIQQAIANDPRVTRVGRFLRRTNLDELPQLFNVVRGDMSLVGPRPHAVAHDLNFSKLMPGYAKRFTVLPGITGWAQVNGLRGPIGSPGDLRKRVEHDLHYVDNWTFWFDLYIIWLTVFSPKAYRNAL